MHQRFTLTNPWESLEKLLLSGGDICIPIDEGDDWELVDQFDETVGQGPTLQAAATAIDPSLYA
jgi:hypothetical protein